MVFSPGTASIETDQLEKIAMTLTASRFVYSTGMIHIYIHEYSYILHNNYTKTERKVVIIYFIELYWSD